VVRHGSVSDVTRETGRRSTTTNSIHVVLAPNIRKPNRFTVPGQKSASEQLATKIRAKPVRVVLEMTPFSTHHLLQPGAPCWRSDEQKWLQDSRVRDSNQKSVATSGGHGCIVNCEPAMGVANFPVGFFVVVRLLAIYVFGSCIFRTRSKRISRC